MTRAWIASLGLVAALTLATSAQAPLPAPPAGLVVGSGNFFSPIVENLENAIAFYRDGLGLEVTGAPSNADQNEPLRNMFGLPHATLRWTIARPAGSRNGVEIIEITSAEGRPLNRRITDSGAMTLIRSTSDDLEPALNRLKALGGTVVQPPGKKSAGGAARIAMVQDPDDHFVELVAAGATATPLPPRIRLTVTNIGKSVALYRDALGLRSALAGPVNEDWLMTALGVTRNGASTAALEVPGSGLVLEFIQFKSNSRRITGRIQDSGSTRLQLQVTDLDAAIKAVVAAGGQVMSTGGVPVELPAGRGTPIRAAIVRDPDNLFLVLIAAQPPRA